MIGTLDSNRREVTIIGAGVAGMLAAYSLDRNGYRVTLLESKARGGGLIQTRKTEYGIVETAAHSLLASPAVLSLCHELGVELAEVRKDSRARYILRDGKLRKFPLSVKETINTIGRATFARAENHVDALTLDAWGHKHLGDAALQYLLTPFVRGIYGIQPDEIGVVAAFPSLVVPEGQTLISSMLRKSLKRSSSKRESHPMVAPKFGMGDLTTRLEQHLEKRLVENFRRGVCISQLPDAANIIISTPAYAAAELLATESPELSRSLREVQYTPLVSVTAFVARESLKKPVGGVGVLVPASEGRQCLGILFTSSSFAGRVFDESRHASFTVLMGGSAQPAWATASDEEIKRAVCEEMAELLGLEGEPLQLVINRWTRAIPQYSTRLPQLWQEARATWCAKSGRILFGNYTGEVSLRGMIESQLKRASSVPAP